MNILRSYKLAASTALLLVGSAAFAQTNSDPETNYMPGGAVSKNWQPSLVRDGVIDRVAHQSKSLDWQNVREADVLWKKRAWREIDTRERQNVAFRYPGDENTGGGYFIEILLDGIKKGKISAYSNFDDRFTSALTKDQINEMLQGKLDTTYAEDPVTGEMQQKITRKEFNPEVVSKYRIKEDWIFDRNIGKMVVRIIGLAPLQDIYNDDGSYRASKPMFWIYFPQARDLLAQYEVFNPENDVARVTWDDFFESRRFSSHIVKISNPYDMSFKEQNYTQMESLYEGQHATEDIFNKEHDMWVY